MPNTSCIKILQKNNIPYKLSSGKLVILANIEAALKTCLDIKIDNHLLYIVTGYNLKKLATLKKLALK